MRRFFFRSSSSASQTYVDLCPALLVFKGANGGPGSDARRRCPFGRSGPVCPPVCPQVSILNRGSVADDYPPSDGANPWHRSLRSTTERKSRGDKTAIELFIAGERGWEAELRRWLEDATQSESDRGRFPGEMRKLENRAALARYLGVIRARVTQVLRRLEPE